MQAFPALGLIYMYVALLFIADVLQSLCQTIIICPNANQKERNKYLISEIILSLLAESFYNHEQWEI